MNLLLIIFLFLKAAHLILSVNEPKDGKIRPTFDEIYGKGWDEDDHQQIKVETSPLNSGENSLNEQTDHDDNIDQDVDSEKEKREVISKFRAMREEYKKKGNVTKKERAKIERKIGNKLGVYRNKIYKWKKEFGLSRKIKINKKSFYEEKKREFIERIDEIKMSQFGEQNKLIKLLGISKDTFYSWKKEFGLPVNSFSECEKVKLMGKYCKIKQRNPKISESDIANILNIPRTTLYGWKKKFINSVDEHSLPENCSTYTDNDTSERPMPSSDNNLWAWNFTKKKRTERIEVNNP